MDSSSTASNLAVLSSHPPRVPGSKDLLRQDTSQLVTITTQAVDCPEADGSARWRRYRVHIQHRASATGLRGIAGTGHRAGGCVAGLRGGVEGVAAPTLVSELETCVGKRSIAAQDQALVHGHERPRQDAVECPPARRLGVAPQVLVLVQWSLGGEIVLVQRQQAVAATGLGRIPAARGVACAVGHLVCPITEDGSAVAFGSVLDSVETVSITERPATVDGHVGPGKLLVGKGAAVAALAETTII